VEENNSFCLIGMRAKLGESGNKNRCVDLGLILEDLFTNCVDIGCIN
jgi:hypothetical protein